MTTLQIFIGKNETRYAIVEKESQECGAVPGRFRLSNSQWNSLKKQLPPLSPSISSIQIYNVWIGEGGRNISEELYIPESLPDYLPSSLILRDKEINNQGGCAESSEVVVAEDYDVRMTPMRFKDLTIEELVKQIAFTNYRIVEQQGEILVVEGRVLSIGELVKAREISEESLRSFLTDTAGASLVLSDFDALVEKVEQKKDNKWRVICRDMGETSTLEEYANEMGYTSIEYPLVGLLSAENLTLKGVEVYNKDGFLKGAVQVSCLEEVTNHINKLSNSLQMYGSFALVGAQLSNLGIEPKSLTKKEDGIWFVELETRQDFLKLSEFLSPQADNEIEETEPSSLISVSQFREAD